MGANVSAEEIALEELKWKIHADRGFNCHLYKDKCLRRRLAVRMRARGAETFEAYGRLLDEDPQEYDRLIDALTINVTKFFRNREMWDVLRESVVPKLFEAPGEVRVWSAGCASGEEPYSVSILVREWAAEAGREEELDRLRILGTDIDRQSLEAAREAVYPPLSFDETPDELRARWFTGGPEAQALVPDAKRQVRFAHHDLISDPPPGQYRLILCRNVIIYFDRSAQERLFQTFFDALEPGGFLVLGRVETLLGRTRALFRPVSTRQRIYVKPA